MFRALIIVLTSLLILGGCSSTKLAYRYADWGIVWWVDDYIPMTSEQESRLEADIRELRRWHCSMELPRYSEWLAQLKNDVRERNFEQSQLRWHQEQVFSFLPPLMDQAKPAITRLLASLSDDQVQQLEANMEKSQKELEDEYLADDPEQTRQARAERTIERAEQWLGSLNEAQRETVESWSRARGQQTEIWLEGRRNWQESLLKTLEHYRGNANFAMQINHLIDKNDQVRGERYQEMMGESRSAMAELMANLLKQADDRHLEHLVDRTRSLQGDFDTLACAGEDTENPNS